MALQESFTREDGHKFILRQSNEGRWSIKCLAPPPPDADTKQWAMLWEVYAWSVGGKEVPFTEAEARKIYQEYMG